MQRKLIATNISRRRDTRAALALLLDAISRYKDLSLLFTDGNAIYQPATQLLGVEEMANIEHIISKGINNEDSISQGFRDKKQAVERVIRTFKRWFKRLGSCSEKMAISQATLLSIWYNFLRPHRALGGKSPVRLSEMEGHARWCRLLEITTRLQTPMENKIGLVEAA